MDKMIQAVNREVTITNDGATILNQMNVIHPVAKLVCGFETYVIVLNISSKTFCCPYLLPDKTVLLG